MKKFFSFLLGFGLGFSLIVQAGITITGNSGGMSIGSPIASGTANRFLISDGTSTLQTPNSLIADVSGAGDLVLNFLKTPVAGADSVGFSFTGTAPSETAANNHIGALFRYTPGNNDADHVIAAGYFELGSTTGSSGRKFGLLVNMNNNATPTGTTFLGTCPTDTAQGTTNVSHGICSMISQNDSRAVAVHGYGGNQASRVGVLGEVAGATVSGIGVWGNYVSGTGTPQFGGLFTIDHAITFPTFSTDAALAASNGTSTDAIFIGYDNVTPAFMILDGGQLQAVAGSATTPTYSFTNGGYSGYGYYLVPASNALAWATGGIEQMALLNNTGVLTLLSTNMFAITGNASPSGGAVDTFLGRNAAATWRFGAANAASPVNQTLTTQGSRGTTDTNTAGGSFTLYSGLGTGTAAVSELIFRTGVVQASGTTQHTLVDAFKITAGGAQNTKGDSFVTADVTNVTTTFANITGLTSTLVSGRKYRFQMSLFLTESTAADGVKIDFNGGTATMTSFVATCILNDAVGATKTQTNATTVALATVINIGATTDANVHRYSCTGAIEPSAAGTFIPRQAQNAHTTGTLTIKRGSHLSIWDMP